MKSDGYAQLRTIFGRTLSPDAFAVKASACDLVALGRRMKAAREALGLTQATFHEQYGYGSVRTYQKNEAGSNEAGICLVESFVRAGINANWLLTGNGPMLLADLEPKPPRINVDALAQAFAVSLTTAVPGETPAQSARKAIEFYEYCLERGLITPNGEGAGTGEKSA